jgi:hypothetical protein
MAGKFVGGSLLELWPLVAGNSLRIFWNSPSHWALADGRKIRWQITSGTHLAIGRQLMAGKFVGGSLLELTWPLAAS